MAPLAVDAAASETTTDAPVEQPELTAEQKQEKIKDLFSAGKRDYISGNFDEAADKLGECTGLSVEVFGQYGVEAFEPHLYYGKTLLELARVDDDVLKNAMKDIPEADENAEANPNDSVCGNPDELTEEERADIADKVTDALTENAEELDKKVEEKEAKEGETEAKETEEKTAEAETKEEEKTAEVETKEEEKTEETKEAEATTAEETDKEGEDEEMEAESSAEGDEEEANTSQDGESQDGEEPTHMQAAWEVLEVARAICDKKIEAEATSEWELKKADVLAVLGECSIEDENYKQAIDDLETALTLQKKNVEVSDRILAQTYFTMARAFKLDDEFGKAAENYAKAKEVIEAKVGVVEKAIESAEGEEKTKLEEELKELHELIPDIQMKVDDAKASEETAQKIKADMKSAMETVATVLSGTGASDEPATDITAMVRKGKRPAEETKEGEEVKKQKAEETA